MTTLTLVKSGTYKVFLSTSDSIKKAPFQASASALFRLLAKISSLLATCMGPFPWEAPRVRISGSEYPRILTELVLRGSEGKPYPSLILGADLIVLGSPEQLAKGLKMGLLGQIWPARGQFSQGRQ